jgi:hypothetical protein
MVGARRRPGSALCAVCIGLLGWTAVAISAPNQAPSRAPFDLAIEKIDVRQVSSTPMFRQVEVHCIVSNRGPKASGGAASVVISRPGDEQTKVLRKVALPEIAPGANFDAKAEGAAWFATPVPYRCELQFAAQAGGDSDSSDDVAEITFPKL